MQAIRIHSVGFRQLFFLYHASAATGFLFIVLFFCISAMGIDSHILFIIAGILMVVLPFFLAPPEIILDIKENTFVFRNGMTYSTIYFSDIKTLTVDNDIMLIKSIQNKENISIYQDHFKHIPLPKMKKYIESILAGNTNFDPWQFNSVKLRGRLLLG